MFKNKKNVKPQEKSDLQKKTNSINDSTDNINHQSDDASLVQEEKQKAQEERQVTVISKKTSLTGDIEFNGDLQICGKVKGQIKSTSGTVSIMRSGLVEGDVFAETVLIDGSLVGSCNAKQLDILEHGELKGICRVSNLAIRKGGSFIGQSEEYDEKNAIKS